MTLGASASATSGSHVICHLQYHWHHVLLLPMLHVLKSHLPPDFGQADLRISVGSLMLKSHVPPDFGQYDPRMSVMPLMIPLILHNEKKSCCISF